MAEAMQMLQFQAAKEEVNNVRADTALKLAQGDKAKAEEMLKKIEADFKDDEVMLENIRLQIDVKETENSAEQNAISREKLDIERQKVKAQANKVTA